MALYVDDVDLSSDGSAVDRARRGDPRAFQDLYELNHDRLYRFCLYQLRNRHDAEDVVQEAFARAWRSLPTFAGDNFYPWLRVIARNLCADAGRRRARVEPMAEVDTGVIEGFEGELTHQVDIALVRAAMDQLSERHRTALEWREREELSYEEIAARAGVSVGTVDSLLWRARQGLKRQYEMLAGEGAMAGVPGLAWVVTHLRRWHARVGQAVSRWSGPVVSLGNLAAISAVGAAAVGGLGGTASVPNLAAVAINRVGVAAAPISANAAASAAGAATTAAYSPLAAGSARVPARSAWAVTNPVSTNPAYAKSQVSQDPVNVSVPGLAVGVDPTSVVHYAAAVVADHAPAVAKASNQGVSSHA